MEKKKALALILLTWLLVSCWNSEIITKNNNSSNDIDEIIKNQNNIKINTNMIDSSQNSSTIDSDWETVKLEINSKCIWCRKCVRFAPSNFTMERSKAIVISQENITSDDVEKAIDKCPVDAISIS